MQLVRIQTEFNPADIATTALDQSTTQKHLAACGVLVNTVNRAADKKDVSHPSGHAHNTPPALILAFWVCRHGGGKRRHHSAILMGARRTCDYGRSL